jgi:ABC-type multidrug transport system ATPase subunit
MNITLQNIGKKFSKEWIFRNIDFQFEKDNYYHISGSNGAGKSTLLQLIAGKISPSEGEINYLNNNINISKDDFYKHVSFVSPYLRLPEEMSFDEILDFYAAFKKMRYSKDILLNKSDIKLPSQKPIKQFSSGMKQRVKIILAIFADTPILLLDEPISNLDASGIEWYKKIVEEEKNNRLIIVCSNNIIDEHFFCNFTLHINKA